MSEKKGKITDKQRLDWLNGVDKITRHAGIAGGWAFSYLIVTEEIPPTEITIALSPVTGLREAIDAAMKAAISAGV